MMSPRGRTLSDSMDYDDELAELHDKRERQLRLAAAPENRFLRELDSDEDTEDASEDGEVRNDEHQEIKEQVYYDKLALLKANLEELEAGNHCDYNRQLSKIDLEYKERKQLNAAWKDYELQCIERDYTNERLLIGKEFEEKKIEMRESLITELEDRRKQIEVERVTMELTTDHAEVKPMSTRKLRRRPNEPVPVPEKRRKTPQSQITFLLDERDIEEDLKAVSKRQKPDCFSYGKKSGSWPSTNSSTSSASEQSDHPVENTAPVHMDARIEDGKLFYEKRWFHRGQQVFIEGKELPRTSGIISGISQDLVWVRKLNEQSKIRVPIASLQKNKMVIKRRA